MSKSTKAKVGEQLARDSQKLRVQKIHKIHAAMEVEVYGAGKVTTTKWSHGGYTQMEPHKQLPNGQRQISRQQKTVWSATSIKWHLLFTDFSINYSNTMSDNYCNNFGLMQPVPEAHSPETLLKWRLLPKRRFMERQILPATSIQNLRSVRPMLRLRPPPVVLVIQTALQISCRERLMVSLPMSGCSSRRNCASAWSSLKQDGRKLALRSSGKPLNNV